MQGFAKKFAMVIVAPIYEDHCGRIEAIASSDRDELLIHQMDFDMIREVRNILQFFHNRRPETYDRLTKIE